MPEQFFSPEEAEEILRRASGQAGAGMSRDQLVQTVQEMGLDPAGVDRAIEQMREEARLKELRVEFNRRQRSKDWGEVGSWVSVSLLLFGINFFSRHSSWWCIWPISIWGFFLLIHLVESWFKQVGGREDEFEKWVRRRERKERRLQVGGADAILSEYFSENPEDDKIGAIKHLREATGLGLKEAKDAVEQYQKLESS